MKKKGIENINIEKNKELFEYEMTEVILKLKGEFVTFSGKGTKYEDNKVAEETLKLELYPLENVSLETYKGEVPDVKKIPPIVLSDIRVEMEKIDDLTSQVEAIGEMHLSSVSKFKKASKEIVVKSIPKLPFICDTFLVKQEYINLPNILGNVQRNALIPNIKMAFIKVKMPTTTIKVSKSGYANAKRIAINVPRTDIKCLYNRAEIKTEKYYIKTVVPSVKLKGIKKVYDISRPNIKGVSIPEFKHVRINPVDTKNIRIIIPNTDIESYRERKVKIEKKNIISEVPNIPVVNECVIDYCELTQKKMEEITIPHFGTEDFKISKIEMNPMQRIEIPLKLDVSDDIDRIVSLAIS